jgi:hypothetical protein
VRELREFNKVDLGQFKELVQYLPNDHLFSRFVSMLNTEIKPEHQKWFNFMKYLSDYNKWDTEKEPELFSQKRQDRLVLLWDSLDAYPLLKAILNRTSLTQAAMMDLATYLKSKS